MNGRLEKLLNGSAHLLLEKSNIDRTTDKSKQTSRRDIIMTCKYLTPGGPRQSIETNN